MRVSATSDSITNQLLTALPYPRDGVPVQLEKL